MNSCVVIQCFAKPHETLQTLKSLERCIGIEQYNLLLFVDSTTNTKIIEARHNLIEILKQYISNNKSFKSIELHISDKCLGPYVGCYSAINKAFMENEFVIFSEDDAIFTRDAILYYNSYRDNKIPHSDSCIGITASSPFYYSDKNIYIDIKKSNDICDAFKDRVNIIIHNSHQYINSIIKRSSGPGKQMGMFKSGWDKIKYYRSPEYCSLPTRKASDYMTSIFISESKFYFYYSIIPRTNDIGLFNEYGCTTLYYNKPPPIYTIKYLTSDYFDLSEKEFTIVNSHPTDTIIS